MERVAGDVEAGHLRLADPESQGRTIIDRDSVIVRNVLTVLARELGVLL